MEVTACAGPLTSVGSRSRWLDRAAKCLLTSAEQMLQSLEQLLEQDPSTHHCVCCALPHPLRVTKPPGRTESAGLYTRLPRPSPWILCPEVL